MIKSILLSLLLCVPCFGAYPFDSVGEVRTSQVWGSCVMLKHKDGKGLMATNAHVIGNNNNCEVWFPGVKKLVKCKTIMVQTGIDLAFIVCDNPPVDPIPVRTEDKMYRGDEIINLGFPSGCNGKLHWQPGYSHYTSGNTLYVTGRPVGGMSGGAMLDKYGQVAAITSQVGPFYGRGIQWPLVNANLALYEDTSTWVIHPRVKPKHNKPALPLARKTNDVRTLEYDPNRAPKFETKK